MSEGEHTHEREMVAQRAVVETLLGVRGRALSDALAANRDRPVVAAYLRARGAAARRLDDLVWLHVRLVEGWGYASVRRAREDLHAEGSIALLYAIDRFDPGRGAGLRTWAGIWIRARVQREAVYVIRRGVRTEAVCDRRGPSAPDGGDPFWASRLLRESSDEGDCADALLEAIERDELRTELRAAMDELRSLGGVRTARGRDPRGLEVLEGRLRGRLQREVGATLGLSDARVQQLESATLQELRGMVAA